jgi:outer membrane protein assembly factor BamB
VIYKDKVIVSNEQEDGSFLIALDCETGKTIWKTERASSKASFATPCVYTTTEGEQQLIFISMANGITGIDPENGNLLWEARDLFDKRTVSSPVVAGEYIIGTCGSGGGGNYLVAVKPVKTDTGYEAKTAFRIRRAAPYVPTPVYKEGRLYLWSDGGIVSCIEVETGDTLWSERVGGRYFGSPILMDDRILCVSDTGEAVWVAAEDEFKILGRVQLSEGSNATPAFSGDSLYLRSESSLISIGGPGELVVE